MFISLLLCCPADYQQGSCLGFDLELDLSCPTGLTPKEEKGKKEESAKNFNRSFGPVKKAL